MLQPPDTINQDTIEPKMLFQSFYTPYATHPLLCLRSPTTPGRPEAPMLKLSTTGVGWGLDLPADDPCRWLTEPIFNAVAFLHHYTTTAIVTCGACAICRSGPPT